MLCCLTSLQWGFEFGMKRERKLLFGQGKVLYEGHMKIRDFNEQHLSVADVMVENFQSPRTGLQELEFKAPTALTSPATC